MSTLQPLPGFDWTRVKWGGPYEAQSDDCSYCGAAIPEDDVPLRLWSKGGFAAVFCDACMTKWWGMQTFKENEL